MSPARWSGRPTQATVEVWRPTRARHSGRLQGRQRKRSGGVGQPPRRRPAARQAAVARAGNTDQSSARLIVAVDDRAGRQTTPGTEAGDGRRLCTTPLDYPWIRATPMLLLGDKGSCTGRSSRDKVSSSRRGHGTGIEVVGSPAAKVTGPDGSFGRFYVQIRQDPPVRRPPGTRARYQSRRSRRRVLALRASSLSSGRNGQGCRS